MGGWCSEGGAHGPAVAAVETLVCVPESGRGRGEEKGGGNENERQRTRGMKRKTGIVAIVSSVRV